MNKVAHTDENGGDAESFVGEDDGAVGVVERSCEIDAVLPRTHLYRSVCRRTFRATLNYITITYRITNVSEK